MTTLAEVIHHCLNEWRWRCEVVAYLSDGGVLTIEWDSVPEEPRITRYEDEYDETPGVRVDPEHAGIDSAKLWALIDEAREARRRRDRDDLADDDSQRFTWAGLQERAR